jgi:hypothetical protein
MQKASTQRREVCGKMGKSKRTTPLILDGLTGVVTESELGSFSL